MGAPRQWVPGAGCGRTHVSAPGADLPALPHFSLQVCLVFLRHETNPSCYFPWTFLLSQGLFLPAHPRAHAWSGTRGVPQRVE